MSVQDNQWIRYRSRKQITDQKKLRLGKYANTWFLRGDTVNTLKIQPTPNSGLKNALHDALSKKSEFADRGSTKMVELGGNLVTSGLSTCQSFGGQGSCYMGTECFTEKETDCRVTRAVYRSECTTCRQ